MNTTLLLALTNLLERHAMEPFDVELNDVNGGSIRVYVKNKESKIQGFPEQQGQRLQKPNQSMRIKMGFDDSQLFMTRLAKNSEQEQKRVKCLP